MIADIKTLTLTRADLAKSCRALFERLDGETTLGVRRLEYTDEFDHFLVQLTRVVNGYDVSVHVNGKFSGQLAHTIVAKTHMLGNLLLVAAAAPAGATITTFFVDKK